MFKGTWDVRRFYQNHEILSKSKARQPVSSYIIFKLLSKNTKFFNLQLLYVRKTKSLTNFLRGRIINLTDEDSMPSKAKHFFNIFTSPIIIYQKKFDLFLTRIDPIAFLFHPLICFIHRFIDENIYLFLSKQIR